MVTLCAETTACSLTVTRRSISRVVENPTLCWFYVLIWCVMSMWEYANAGTTFCLPVGIPIPDMFSQFRDSDWGIFNPGKRLQYRNNTCPELTLCPLDGSLVFFYGYFICQPLITAYSVNTSFIDCSDYMWDSFLTIFICPPIQSNPIQSLL